MASGDEPTAEQPLPFDLKVLCMNIRGAVSSAAGHETHSTGLCQMTQLLHELGVGLAIISGTRFGDGMVWPSWTGYSFSGARSPKNESVCVS